MRGVSRVWKRTWERSLSIYIERAIFRKSYRVIARRHGVHIQSAQQSAKYVENLLWILNKVFRNYGLRGIADAEVRNPFGFKGERDSPVLIKRKSLH